MDCLSITKEEAKGFLISYQGLITPKLKPSDNKTTILDFINKLGCIQYDPLNVVGRNPDLVLQSRINDYKANDLNELLYKDRKLIDGWDKMMAIYLTTDWPFFHLLREHHTQSTENTLAYRNSLDALNMTHIVKDYIKQNGPTPSSKLTSKSKSDSVWGHKKLTSAALDYLYAVGELGIYDKINTQKIYDLIENLLPPSILNTPYPFSNDDAFIDWYVLRRLDSVGFLWNKNGGAWLGYFIQSKSNRSQSLKRLLDNGLITTCNIESFSEPFYMTKKVADELNVYLTSSKKSKKEVRFIAPLDNLLWDRDLVLQLFDFHYRWEVYTPLVKRQYGYYVLPILYGHDLIGRIEFDYYRGETSLSVKQIWFEPSFKQTKSFDAALERALNLFLNYLRSSYNSDNSFTT